MTTYWFSFIFYVTFLLYTIFISLPKGRGAGAGAGGAGADCDLDIIKDQGLSAKRTPSTWFIFLKCLCDDGNKKVTLSDH